MLNVVTVPMGAQIGTDSGAGEGKGDHTEWGVLYDHRSNALYWRTQFNQNYQRLRLADLPSLTAPGAARQYLSLASNNGLPWFHDAAGSFN